MLIFRLEAPDGLGPYETTSLKAPSLAFHEMPEDLLESSKISKTLFKTLMSENYIFGWSSEEKYISFFAGRNLKIKLLNEKKAYKQGFKKKVYECNNYYLLSDGQVIFKVV